MTEDIARKRPESTTGQTSSLQNNESKASGATKQKRSQALEELARLDQEAGLI